MLKQRIATGVTIIVFLVAALFYLPKSWFAGFIAAVVLLASWEWSNLAGLRTTASRLGFVVGSAVLLFAANAYLLQASRDSHVVIMASACAWWLIAFLWVITFPVTVGMWGNSWVKVLMGWFVLIPTWLALAVLLNSQGFSSLGAALADNDNSGRWILVIVILIVILMDTGAYASGRMFGRRKLAPLVSPGKTWAGVVGGLSVNGLLLCVLGWQLQADAALWLLLTVLVVATAASSVLGDLLESMIKRQRNIKDSGSILPGHGGVLDRVDGMTAAFPVFTLIYLLNSSGSGF